MQKEDLEFLNTIIENDNRTEKERLDNSYKILEEELDSLNKKDTKRKAEILEGMIEINKILGKSKSNATATIKSIYKNITKEQAKERFRYVVKMINTDSSGYKKLEENILNLKERKITKKIKNLEEARDYINNNSKIIVEMFDDIDLKDTDLFNKRDGIGYILTDKSLFIKNWKKESRIKTDFKYALEHQNDIDYGIKAVNLYMYVTKMEYKEAIFSLMRIVGLTLQTKFTDFLESQNNKFINNVEMIDQINKDTYPHTHKLIGKYLYLLKEINYKSLETSYAIDKVYRNQNIFFYTNSCLAKYSHFYSLENNCSELSIGGACSFLNTLLFIGLIKIVPVKMVPDKYFFNPSGKNPPKWYYISEYTPESLKFVEDKAKKLLNAKISATTITKEKATKIIGKTEADKLFIYSIPKTKKALGTENEEDRDIIPATNINAKDVQASTFTLTITKEDFDDMPF